MTATLILLRHGQSTWNLENLFTGWTDVPLTEQGVTEAKAGGRLIRDAGYRPDHLHTSVLQRAIATADLCLAEGGWGEVPTTRSWRLNERHYGALQGLDKKETAARYGDEQVLLWRRSYDVRPPAIDRDDTRHPIHDPLYADVDPVDLPSTESLADVGARLMPYWETQIVPQLEEGLTPLVVAHGNSIRALVKHLDNIDDAEIVDLNIPTGIPLVYDLGAQLRPVSSAYLGDEAAAQAAAEEVARQAG